ncbi:MAG TPA: hypothetical protein VGS80_03320 [Ktedonobacterales bacterium]|nr:hypothetical protein [Ktedonobacterales bacterium]
MRPRIVGGVAGWAAAVTPLIAVNVASLAGLFDFATMAVAGALALLGGILLGGAIAGGIAGRPRGAYAGGALAGAQAGGIVALLYGATALALVLVTSVADTAPPLLVDNLAGIVRMMVAVVFVAALVVAIAFAAGWLSGQRRQAPVAMTPTHQAAAPTPGQSGGFGRSAAAMHGTGRGEEPEWIPPARQDTPRARYDMRNGGDPRSTGSRPRSAQSAPSPRRAGVAGREDGRRW